MFDRVDQLAEDIHPNDRSRIQAHFLLLFSR
jgi:hypothetical protein